MLRHALECKAPADIFSVSVLGCCGQQSGVHTHVFSMHCVCDVMRLVVREAKQFECCFVDFRQESSDLLFFYKSAHFLL